MALSIKELAALAKVSIATVSYVVNGKAAAMGISPKTVARVEELARTHGYIPNRNARMFQSGRRYLLAVVAPNLSNEFFGHLIYALERRAAAGGVQTILCNTNHDPAQEEQIIRSLIAQRVDGVAVLPIALGAPWLDLLKVYAIPTVFFRPRGGARPRGLYLAPDNAAAYFMTTTHLIEQGCRRIAFVNHDPYALEHNEPAQVTHHARTRGYRRALTQAGLRPPGGRQAVIVEDLRGAQGAGRAVDRLIQLRVDGVAGYSDLACLQLLNPLRERGVSVPGDVKLIGCDDCSFAPFLTPPLSSVALEQGRLGELICEKLLAMYESGAQEEGEILCEPRLAVRASSAG